LGLPHIAARWKTGEKTIATICVAILGILFCGRIQKKINKLRLELSEMTIYTIYLCGHVERTETDNGFALFQTCQHDVKKEFCPKCKIKIEAERDNLSYEE